jgi:hypothetical protein
MSLAAKPRDANLEQSFPRRPCLATLLQELHEREGGMISMVSVVALLFIMVLIGLTANIGYTINQKKEVQNSADAVAYTSTIWLARGMNVITATNHLIGEMQALVVLHAAVGGEEMENKNPLDPQEAEQAKANLDAASSELDTAWRIAKTLGASTPAYQDETNKKVGEQVKSGATLRASMTDLKKALAKVYYAKAGASILEKSVYPPTVAIGEAIDAVATGVELVILAEYTALKALEAVAKAAIPFRDLLFNTLLPGAAALEKFAADNVPRFAAQAGKAVARKNQTTGGVYPGEPPLPVFLDNASSKIGDADLPRSALVRTSYPWVKYDRTPLLRAMSWMIFSHCRKHYVNYTDRYTLLKAKELYGNGFSMYVMTKRGEQKGSEPWTASSNLADRKFTLVGFAHRPPRTVASRAVFGVPNRDGIVACAQAILYNVNSQNPGNGPPTYQPEVGWDTLNWWPPVTSSGAYEFKEGPEETDLCPRILVNWQAKLTPVTRLDEAARSGEVGGPIDAVLQRLGSSAKRWQTH